MAKKDESQFASFAGFALGTATALTIVIVLNPELRKRTEGNIGKILSTSEVILEAIKVHLDGFVSKRHQESEYEAQPTSQWDTLYRTMQE